MSNTERGIAVSGAADAAGLRSASTDREIAVRRLQRAAAEGRIDLTELDERLIRVYSSKTYAELDELFTDLPASGHVSWPLAAETETLVLRTVTPNIKQSGRWVVPRHIVAESKTGFITVDFTEASCAYDEIEVSATTAAGRIRLILPTTWAAHIDPSSTNTAHITNHARATAGIDGTTVIIAAHPLSGYIKIKQRH